MDRGAWRATAHVVTESDKTEELTLSFTPALQADSLPSEPAGVLKWIHVSIQHF